MDNVLIILGLLLICSVPVQASELLGSISTDPTAIIADSVLMDNTITQNLASTIAGLTQTASTTNVCVGTGQCPVPTKAIKPTIAPRTTTPLVNVLGQKIYADQAKKHPTGDLIRMIGDVKVYALKKPGKHHVLNLAELAKDYFGLTIYNLKPEEMKQY